MRRADPAAIRQAEKHRQAVGGLDGKHASLGDGRIGLGFGRRGLGVGVMTLTPAGCWLCDVYAVNLP